MPLHCSAVLNNSSLHITHPSMLITGCEESLWIYKETKSVFPLWTREDGMVREVQEQGIFKEYFFLYPSTQKWKLPTQPVKHISSIWEQVHVQDTLKASMKFAALIAGPREIIPLAGCSSPFKLSPWTSPAVTCAVHLPNSAAAWLRPPKLRLKELCLLA